MRWLELRNPEIEDLARPGSVALLPFGAIEAHGPHLPLGTDGIIAEAMAREAARLLASEGVRAVILPTLWYAPAPFAAGFGGTLSVRAESVVASILDLAHALAERGVEALALANVHFDPQQVSAVREAAAAVAELGRPRIVFPDLTRRALAERLGDEFRSGACHAGRFESSIVLAERPELVDRDEMSALPELPISLPEAIARGDRTFEAAGLARAYCGDPASATAEEGRELVRRLGEILAAAVRSG